MNILDIKISSTKNITTIMLFLLFFFFCTKESKNPIKIEQQKNIKIEIENPPKADIYGITVISSNDPVMYYEKITSNIITISIPSDTSSTIIIDLYQSDTKKYSAIIDLDKDASGQLKTTVFKVTETNPNPPDTVSNIHLSTDSSQVQIQWDAVSTAEGYNIYRSDNPEVQPVLILKTDKVSISDTTVLQATTYYYFVSSFNAAGESKKSKSYKITVPEVLETLSPPETPSGLSMEALSETSIRIWWDSTSLASSYLVQYSEESKENYISKEVTTTVYRIDDLKPSTQYYIRVVALNQAGKSDPSAEKAIKTLDIALQVPSTPVLSIGKITDASIEINWVTVQNAAFYIIEQSSSTSGSFTPVCTTTSLSYVGNGLNPSSTYYFRAKSINSAGESAYSTTISGKTESALLPPTAVTAKASGTSSISVSWQKSTGAEKYIIFAGASESTFKAIDTIESTSYTHTELEASTTYYYAVSSMTDSKISAKSQVVSAKTESPLLAPETPTGLKATVTSSTSISLSFNYVSGAVSYNLYWSTNDTTFTLLTTLTSTSYTHNNLTAGTTCYYKISATGNGLESALSSSVWATTQTSKKIATINSRCTGCGNCVSACKQKAITRSGMKYVIDPSKCNGCGDCVSRCRHGAITLN